MKRHDYLNGVISAILSSLVALAGIGCLVSGFSLDVEDHTHIVSLCVAFALFCSICFHIRWGNLILTFLGILALFAALQWTDLLLSAEKLLYSITNYYDHAYDCGFIRWSEDSLRFVCVDTALTALAFPVIMAVCWTVCRRKWFGFGVIAGLMPLILCCVVTDTVPSEVFLWTLLTPLLLLTLTQRLRRIQIEDATRLTAWLLVPVVLFSSLVFRLSPEDGYEDRAQKIQVEFMNLVVKLSELLPTGTIPIHVPGATLPPSAYLVIQEQVDLTHAGPRDMPKQTVMYITSPTGGNIYLRGQSYDTYTGTGWESNIDTAGEGGWPEKGLVTLGELTIRTAGYSAMYYTPYYPGSSDWIGQLHNGHLPNPRLESEYSFDVKTHGRNVVITCTPLSDYEREIYLSLPESTRQRATAILDKLIGNIMHIDDARMAELIEKMVRLSARYDTNTDYMPEGETDFAMWFMEQGNNTGYCVHFASAATVLLRAAGIPARYVTGYLANATAGKETAVTADRSHAWVEYYHPVRGWVVLDATPGAGDDIPVQPTTKPTETTTPTETTQPTETTTPTETTQPTETTTPTETTQPTETTTPSSKPVTLPTETTPPASDPTGTTPPTAPAEPDTPQEEPEKLQLNLEWIKYILQILILWALLAGQYKLRIKLRKKWLDRGTPNQQARKRWRYARYLSRITSQSAQELLPLAEKAVFSQHTLTPEELAVFDEWYRKASMTLLKKPWLWQFFLRLIFAVE